MKNEWIVFEVPVRGSHVEIVSAILASFNCGGVVVEERQLDSFTVPDDRLEPDLTYRLKAYFVAVVDAQGLRNSILEALTAVPALSEERLSISLPAKVQMEDWAENWKQNFSLMRIGTRLVIRPSWEEYEPSAGEVVIEIDPGMAFGTGTHATTLLCLEAIAELLDGASPPGSMLDVGTGSGILALGAAVLGCPEICAIDIDPGSCTVAQQNVVKNGLSHQIKVSEAVLESLPGTYDLVVANILAEENLRLKDALWQHLKPGGWLILSGILAEKERLVRTGFATLDLADFPTRAHDDWICLLYQRPV